MGEIRASRQRRGALLGIGLLAPSAALVLAFTLFPVAYNVWLGFYAKHSLRASSTWVGLGNYTQIFGDPDFWRSVQRKLREGQILEVFPYRPERRLVTAN